MPIIASVLEEQTTELCQDIAGVCWIVPLIFLLLLNLDEIENKPHQGHIYGKYLVFDTFSQTN